MTTTSHHALTADRRAELLALAHDLAQLLRGGRLEVTFICTHNSRRSHLAQVWAQLAAREAGLEGVSTYSGGTEVTALNPNVAAALRRAGWSVEALSEGSNPVYAVEAPDASDSRQRCFSKLHDDDANPQEGFAAVLTCSSAASECPSLPGAALRRELLYEDPKAFDGTPDEAAAYDACCARISGEMRFLFRRVAELAR